MFDPLQKSMLIDYFTNRDVFLNKLVPKLSVYLDQCKVCMQQLEALNAKPQSEWRKEELKEVKLSSDGAFVAANMIIKEMVSIWETYVK